MKSQENLSLRRKFAFSFIAIALFVLLLMALGETAVRLIAPRSDPVKLGVKLENSDRLYGLRPNHSSTQTGVVVQTNSLGFREREYPVERVPGVRRIVVLGDSYTLGVGVDFPETYSKRLEARLNKTGQPYEVINFGIHGYNTLLELATFREVAARFEPDLVVLGYVLNDTERLGAPQAAQPEARAARSFLNRAHVLMKDTSMLYRYLSPKLGAVASLFGARYALGGTNEIVRSYDEDSAGWAESRQALLDLADEARRLGAPLLVVVFPMMVDFATYPLKPAHDKIAQFCTDHGIEVLDLVSALEGQEISDMIVPLDGHPNGRAHGIFADRIFRHLADEPEVLGAAGRAIVSTDCGDSTTQPIRQVTFPRL